MANAMLRLLARRRGPFVTCGARRATAGVWGAAQLRSLPTLVGTEVRVERRPQRWRQSGGCRRTGRAPASLDKTLTSSSSDGVSSFNHDTYATAAASSLRMVLMRAAKFSPWSPIRFAEEASEYPPCIDGDGSSACTSINWLRSGLTTGTSSGSAKSGLRIGHNWPTDNCSGPAS